MADRRPSWQEVTSPTVSLRQAVRPAIVAYGILSHEQQVAGALPEEAEALLEATEDLLRKLGLTRLFTPGGRQVIPELTAACTRCRSGETMLVG